MQSTDQSKVAGCSREVTSLSAVKTQRFAREGVSTPDTSCVGS
jgi:hypothetical protein